MGVFRWLKSILANKLPKRRTADKQMEEIIFTFRSVLARTSEHLKASSQALLCANKKTHPKWVCFVGAEKRIRTSGTFQAHTRFPIVLLKPLRHLCNFRRSFRKAPIYITLFFQKMQAFLLHFEKNIVKTYFVMVSSTISAFTALIETLFIPFITPFFDL